MMTKPGPHIFDNYVAETLENANFDLLELEQCHSTLETTQFAVLMQPRGRKALVVKVGWTGEQAWVEVTKRDMDTGAAETVSVMPMPDEGILLT